MRAIQICIAYIKKIVLYMTIFTKERSRRHGVFSIGTHKTSRRLSGWILQSTRSGGRTGSSFAEYRRRRV